MGDHAQDSINAGMDEENPFGYQHFRHQPRRRRRNHSVVSKKNPKPPSQEQLHEQGRIFEQWHDDMASDPAAGYDKMSIYEIAWLAWERAYKAGFKASQGE